MKSFKSGAAYLLGRHLQSVVYAGLLKEVQMLMKQRWISSDITMPTGNSSHTSNHTDVYDHCNSYGTCAECSNAKSTGITLIGTSLLTVLTVILFMPSQSLCSLLTVL